MTKESVKASIDDAIDEIKEIAVSGLIYHSWFDETLRHLQTAKDKLDELEVIDDE